MNFVRSDMHSIAEVVKKDRKFPDLFLIRRLMDSIDKWNLSPEEVLCHRLIRSQHEVLDQLGCCVSFVCFQRYRTSCFVEHHLSLWKIKVHRASSMPLCPKKSRECLHLLKHGYKIPVNPALLFVPVFQNSLHRRVRHASVHPDHAFHDLMIYDPLFH